MDKQSLPWRSILLAPLASIPAETFAGLGSSDAGIASDFLLGLFYIGPFLALPLSYLGMALIGVPVFLVLRRFGLLRLWILGAMGVFVPLAIFVDAPIQTTVATVASGLSVSLTGYFLLPVEARLSLVKRDA